MVVSFRTLDASVTPGGQQRPNYRRALTKNGVEKGSGTVCVAVCPDVCPRYMDRGLLLNIMI